jgi:NhaP-type Na+/H+ or K+/H+ antiporter
MATFSLNTAVTMSNKLVLLLSALLLYVAHASNITTTTEEEQYGEYDNPQHAILYPWLVITLGVAVSFVLQQYELPVPYAAVMFTVGMIMGVAAFRLDGRMEFLNQSIRQWSDINSSVLLLVFLPGLIFRDAIEINVLTFFKSLGQLFTFAFPMVLVGTVLTAAVVVYVLPQDFSWSLALTVGSILASTDPVAVASVLKAADAPPRLQMHIGGESMLNDGAAVVFYLIFSQQFLAELDLPSGSTVTIGQGIVTFFRMSLGGVAVGLAFAMGLLVLLYELDRRLEKENNVLQVAAAVSVAYLSYYCSEQVCQMSGVIACVTCGITAKAWGNGLITDPDLMDSYLKLVEYLLNTVLFTLGGTVFGEVIANSAERAPFTATEWWSLLVLYVSVMVIRGLQVLLFYPVVSRIGLKTVR